MPLRLSPAWNSQVESVVLTGLSTASSAVVSGTDTVLSGLGKLQAQSTINAQALGDIGRNKLLNGRFNIAQRGTGPWTTSGTYTADRWTTIVLNDSFSASIVSLTDADRTAIGDESAVNAMQFVIGGTSNGFSQFVQDIENVRTVSDKTVTVSYWGKASVAGLSIGSYLSQNFGTGGSPSGGVDVSPATFGVSTSWARYSTTFTLASTAGKTLGTNNDHSTGVYLCFSAYPQAALICGVPVQSGTFTIWGVQLEIGASISPFESRPIDIDLAACQRFYQIYPTLFVGGIATAANQLLYQQIILPTVMRAVPTVTYSAQTYTNSSAFASQAVRATDLVIEAKASAAGAVTATAAATLSADI